MISSSALARAPLPVGMAAVLRQRLTPKQLADTMLTAKRWTADEALKEGIVDEIVTEGAEKTIERAIQVAQAHARLSATGVSHPPDQRLASVLPASRPRLTIEL